MTFLTTFKSKTKFDLYDCKVTGRLTLQAMGFSKEGTINEPLINGEKFSFNEVCQKISPLLMISGSGLIFCVIAVLSKLMSIPPGQYVSTEAAFNIPLCLLICCYHGVDLSPFSIQEKRMWFCGRVILSGLGYVTKILVVKDMNIGDAIAILSSAPIWAGILARIFFREKYTIVNLFCAIFGLVGVILISKPGTLFPSISGTGESSVPWAFATFGASLITALSFLCARGVGTVVHPMKLVFYTAIVEFLSGFLMNSVMNQSLVLPPCGWVRVVLILCGMGATLAILLVVRGLTLENSGPATLMRNADIVSAYIFQITLFKTTPDLMSLVGAGIILFTVLLQGFDKLFDISCGVEF